jgi:hypothetical protein
MLNPLTAKALIAYVDRLRIEVGNASESLLKRINFCYRLVVSKKIQELKDTVSASDPNHLFKMADLTREIKECEKLLSEKEKEEGRS